MEFRGRDILKPDIGYSLTSNSGNMKNKVKYSLYSLAITVIVIILSVVGVISLWHNTDACIILPRNGLYYYCRAFLLSYFS